MWDVGFQPSGARDAGRAAEPAAAGDSAACIFRLAGGSGEASALVTSSPLPPISWAVLQLEVPRTRLKPDACSP
jgi:hypothetical protein